MEGKEVPLKVRVEEMTEERVSAQAEAPVKSFGMKVDNLTPRLRWEFGIGGNTADAVMVSVDQGSIADPWNFLDMQNRQNKQIADRRFQL